MKKLKWAFILLFIIAIGFAGYRITLSNLSDKLMEQFAEQIMDSKEIEQMINDPEIRKLIEENAAYFDAAALESLKRTSPALSGKQADKPAKQTDTGPNGQDAVPAKLVITSREQASELLLSKFSANELMSLVDMAKNGLDDQEKNTIKTKLLGQLSEQELESLKIVALMEVVKRQQTEAKEAKH